MKHRIQKKRQAATAGLTMIEVTMVVSALLGLISVSFFGVNAYKNGSDRAMCIVHVTQVQKAVRSFANFHLIDPGGSHSGLKDAVIGPGRFIEEIPVCPSGGTYSFLEDRMPEFGETYMSCSIEEHRPTTTYRW